MSGTANTSTAADGTTETFVMDLKREEWPASLHHILADPVVQQHARACPMTGWLIIVDIHKFMDAVHRRYLKTKTFDRFKGAMVHRWGWICVEQRGDNFCHFVHEMGFGRGGFDWAKHPTTDEIQEVR